jgi:hypothetical protein
MSIEEYENLVPELRLKPIVNKDVKIINVNYIPNYQFLDLHQKMLILATKTPKSSVVDKLALDNLIKYHADCLEDLKLLQQRS